MARPVPESSGCWQEQRAWGVDRAAGTRETSRPTRDVALSRNVLTLSPAAVPGAHGFASFPTGLQGLFSLSRLPCSRTHRAWRH